MKKIEAFVRPGKLPALQESLSAYAFFDGTTATVRGMDSRRGHTMLYRGSRQSVEPESKVKIELFVQDDRVEAAIEAIVSITRKSDSAHVFVVSAEEVVPALPVGG